MAEVTHILVDGVMNQNAIKMLYSYQEPISLIPLYINTNFQANYDLGPILVSVLPDSQITAKIKSQTLWANSATILHSNENAQVIAEHLKQLITVTNEAGSELIFRFADPLVAWYWLHSFKPDELAKVMGPINQWHIAKPNADWQQPQPIHWQITHKPKDSSALDIKLNVLYPAQEQALEQTLTFKYLNRIYQWLQQETPTFFADKTPEQIGQWLNNSYTDAKVFNLISERSIATWINLSTIYGTDFAETPNGLYQQWLINNPTQKPLPNEVKIQQFYQDLAQEHEQTTSS